MKHPRYFLFEALQRQDHLIKISGEEFHHMIHVNRLQVGDTCRLINGSGLLADGRIHTIHKNHVEITVLTVNYVSSTDSIQTILLQAIPGKGIFGSIIEKAVELGVVQIVPLLTEYSIAKVTEDEKFVAKYQAVANQALKQCRRLYRARVHVPTGIKDIEHFIESSSIKLLLDPYEGITFSQFLDRLRQGRPGERKSFACAIGPEGGFSDEEISQFEAMGFWKLSFPGHVLRVETAVISFLGLLRFALPGFLFECEDLSKQ